MARGAQQQLHLKGASSTSSSPCSPTCTTRTYPPTRTTATQASMEVVATEARPSSLTPWAQAAQAPLMVAPLRSSNSTAGHLAAPTTQAPTPAMVQAQGKAAQAPMGVPQGVLTRTSPAMEGPRADLALPTGEGPLLRVAVGAWGADLAQAPATAVGVLPMAEAQGPRGPALAPAGVEVGAQASMGVGVARPKAVVVVVAPQGAAGVAVTGVGVA